MRKAFAFVALLLLASSDAGAMDCTMLSAPDGGYLQTMCLGVEVGLDNDKVYFNEDGAWSNGAPGTNRGRDIKLGSPAAGAFVISAPSYQQRLLASGAFMPNFGDTPLAYALPARYRPWRDQMLR